MIALSEHDGTLRYRVLHADLPDGAHPNDAALALSGRALIDTAAVSAHAIRYLALLTHTDPDAGFAALVHPGLWALIAESTPGCVGSPYPARRPASVDGAPADGTPCGARHDFCVTAAPQ